MATSRTPQVDDSPISSLPDVSRFNIRTPNNSPEQFLSLNSWNSPRKRRHGEVDSPSEYQQSDESRSNNNTDKENAGHDEKRSRRSDWPQERSPETQKTQEPGHRVPRHSVSPRRRALQVNPRRSSKFIEGSMNDRVSQRPPSVFIRDEQAMEKYAAGCKGGENQDTEYMGEYLNAGIESSRPSSMYRFGRALVNAFNPVSLWHGMNGSRKEKQDDRIGPEKTLLYERQCKAEKAYAELKEQRYPGTKQVPSTDNDVDMPDAQEEDKTITPAGVQRDPSFESEGYRLSTDRKMDGMTFDREGRLMLPPLLAGNGRSASPYSEASSGVRSSLHLHKPSFANLKKVKSHLQMTSIKRNSALSPVSTVTTEHDPSEVDLDQNVIRKSISKRDLNKQQKLTKKVSNLETKLERARRELRNSMQEVPPVPTLPSKGALKTFVPGALASLPSERNMLDEARLEKAIHRPSQVPQIARPSGLEPTDASIGEPLLVNKPAEVYRSTKVKEPNPSKEKDGDKAPVSVAIFQSASINKRKASGQRDSGCMPNSDDEVKGDEDDKIVPVVKRKRGRPSKSLNSHENRERVESSEIISRKNVRSSVSLETSKPADVHPTRVSSLRSNPKKSFPLSGSPLRNPNLEGELPSMFGNQQKKEIALTRPPTRGKQDSIVTSKTDHVFDPLKTGNKAKIDHTSVSHHNEPPASFLGPPIPTSPTRLTRKPSRPFRSPPISPENSRPLLTSRRLNSLEGQNDIITVSPTKDKNVPPMPKVPKELEAHVVKVAVEEAHEPEKDFQWDEDVF